MPPAAVVARQVLRLARAKRKHLLRVFCQEIFTSFMSTNENAYCTCYSVTYLI